MVAQLGHAHVVQRRPTADSVIAMALSEGAGGPGNEPRLLSILRNERGAYAGTLRDALGDSLTSRAITNRADMGRAQESASYNMASRAVTVLGRSGMPRLVAGRAGSNQPHAGALDRFIRIDVLPENGGQLIGSESGPPSAGGRMRKSRFTDEQKISILQQAVPGKIRDLCRKHGITEQTFYRWRGKYDGYRSRT